jgi:hypothetical protein
MNAVAHDASWDAFMTGAVFARCLGRLAIDPASVRDLSGVTVEELGSASGEGLSVLSSTSWNDILRRHGNVVHLMRSLQRRWVLGRSVTDARNLADVQRPFATDADWLASRSSSSSSSASSAAPPSSPSTTTTSTPSSSSSSSSSSAAPLISSRPGPNAATVVVRGMTTALRTEDVLAMVGASAGVGAEAVSRQDVIWGNDQTAFVRLPSVEAAARLVRAARAARRDVARDEAAEARWLHEQVGDGLPSDMTPEDAVEWALYGARVSKARDEAGLTLPRRVPIEPLPWALDPYWRPAAWGADAPVPNPGAFLVQTYADYLRERSDVFADQCAFEVAGAPGPEDDEARALENDPKRRRTD